jgi:hypothetical protein
MGGAVNPVLRTPAEDTVLLLQKTARDGSPVLIPGAWSPGAVAPVVQVTGDADRQAALAAQTSVTSDPEKLARELEGGGAPSQRRRGHRTSFLTRFWRSILHPTEIRIIRSLDVPQAR